MDCRGSMQLPVVKLPPQASSLPISCSHACTSQEAIVACSKAKQYMSAFAKLLTDQQPACSPVLHKVQGVICADVETENVCCECELQVCFLACSFLAPNPTPNFLCKLCRSCFRSRTQRRRPGCGARSTHTATAWPAVNSSCRLLLSRIQSSKLLLLAVRSA